jgi:NTP pyrophosphatase (non-canonical NTP hydrolase)
MEERVQMMVNPNNQSIQKINQFRDDRNWRQFHNEKDLALSISLEAAELLEIYQWKTAEEGNQALDHIKEELADVLIYAYMLADNLQLDIDQIISEKIVKNALKYPINKSKDSRQKYSDL